MCHFYNGNYILYNWTRDAELQDNYENIPEDTNGVTTFPKLMLAQWWQKENHKLQVCVGLQETKAIGIDNWQLTIYRYWCRSCRVCFILLI